MTMFSDTHFHFKTMLENSEASGVEVLSRMAERDCFFGLDIGTRADDLLARQSVLEKTIAQMADSKLADKARNFIYFSAGIWPDPESIANRFECMKVLEQQIQKAQTDNQDILNRKIVAVGECGIDHHWNPAGVDGRCESDFDQKMYEWEKELFMLQLEVGRKMDLPVIVHSRDGFEETLDCIKTAGWHKGIIHCYSYGLEEARAFLDLGWHISFSGSVTYTKKTKMEDMKQLLNYVPEDRILCETDAPYLAPVPFRGQKNTPVLVEHTYRFIAEQRGITVEKLCGLVDENSRNLFNLK